MRIIYIATPRMNPVHINVLQVELVNPASKFSCFVNNAPGAAALRYGAR